MTELLNDKILVFRAARGDSIAFSELVNRHYCRTLGVAFGLLRNRADAEDIVQDAFARVYCRLGSFEGSSAFYTWLYRITVNLCIDYLRRCRRQRLLDVETEQEMVILQCGAEDLWHRYDDTHPDDHAQRNQFKEQLNRAFAGLPEIHQAVLLLRELEGLSYDEIAESLQIKKGTVMSRLFHARRSLQERCKPFANFNSKVLSERS
jgi:RNA polymerase sigma-70 factor, ECF subfamily